MSVTYPADPLKPYGDRSEVRPVVGEQMNLNPHLNGAEEEPFVPVYARRGKSARGNGGKIKTWMILAPVGVLMLGGFGAMMLMDKGDEPVAPLVEPAATAPVVPATAPPLPTTTITRTLTPEPAPAPVLREATPARRAPAPAPARRATPTAPRATATAPIVRAAPPAPSAASTLSLNTAPTTSATAPSTPAPAAAQPPAPVIVVQPLT